MGLRCVLTAIHYTSLFSKSDHFFYPIQCIVFSGKKFLFVWVNRIAYLNLDNQYTMISTEHCLFKWKKGADMFLYGWMSWTMIDYLR